MEYRYGTQGCVKVAQNVTFSGRHSGGVKEKFAWHVNFSGLSGKLQNTNPKLQTWGVLRTGLNAFGDENKMVSFIR